VVVTLYPWSLCNVLELAALPSAVPCARLHARHLLREWGLDGLAETTELLTSELVTNAVQATAGYKDQSVVSLRLSTDHVRVLIEVWDADPRPLAPRHPGKDEAPAPEAEGGRGLFLVSALSLDPPMILKAGSRFPRSDPRYPFQEAALTRCSRQ